jgi:HEAT repeat protein
MVNMMKTAIKPAGHRTGLPTGLLTTALLLVVPLTAAPALQPKQEKPMTGPNDLLSEQSRTRDQAVDNVLKGRKSVIEQLVPLIDPANAKKYSDQTRSAAAYLLGELRAVEAVPVLSKALADSPGPKVITDMSRYDAPVWTALFKIGRPAVPAMIENVETSDDLILREGSLDVLNHVLGGKRRLLELLVKLEKRSTDREVTRRIEEARSWAERHYKEDEEPLY